MADKKVSDLPSLNGADVDPADLLYIVDSSAGAAGSKKITIGQYQLAPVSGGTANTVVYLNGSKVESSSSALTFDGTNLGVGTSLPGAKLEVASGKVLLSNTQSYAIKTSAGVTCDVVTLTSGNVLQLGGGGATDSIQFWNQGLERMRLDSSGNLGLGVTPSAWGGGFKALEMSNGSVSINANGPYINQNAIYDTAWKYKANGLAAQYYQNAGVHYWQTAPSGTAGNAISFTQAMTLDASGQLSVGAVLAENSTGVYLLPTGEMRVKDSTENGTSQISIYNTNTTNDSEQFFVAMNSADVDIGNKRTDGGALKLFTSNTERARITSGGDLLVGTTTTSGAGGITLFNNGSTGFSFVNNNNASATGYVFSSYRRSSVEIGSITQNGTTAVLFNTTSDRRLKDNIVPAPSASDVIDAIEIVSHDWKSAPDEHVTYGVIAQDLALVAPQAVLQGNDGNEIEKTWGVDYSKLVPMLIKEIQSLRARVAALEAK